MINIYPAKPTDTRVCGARPAIPPRGRTASPFEM